MTNNGSSDQYKNKVMSALQDKSTLISLGIFIVFLIIAGILIFTNQRRISVSNIDDEAKNQPSANQQQPSAAPEQGQRYTVKENETLWSIAEQAYGSGYNWVDIVEANNITNPDMVSAGTQLAIPSVEPKMATTGQVETGEVAATQTQQAQPKTEEVTVQAGDTLWSIATQVYGDGYAWTEIARANNLANPNYIHAGTRLTMPKR
jgi:nucleoid-associated protein YgaU